MKIGMRNIKTAIAVFICVVICSLLNIHSPFLACVAAILCMQSNVIESIDVAKHRFLGTLLGALVGFLFSLLDPSNMFLIGIGIIIIISLCNLLKWNNSIAIGCIVFLSVMFGATPNVSPLNECLIRLLETFIGIIVALLVNYFIAPPNHITRIYHSCHLLKDKALDLIKQRICYKENIDTSAFFEEIQHLSTELEIYTREQKFTRDKTIEIDNIKRTIMFYKDIYFHLKILNNLYGDYHLSQENLDKVKLIYDIDIESLKGSNEEESVVFNYHVSTILNEFLYLQGLSITSHEEIE